MTYLIELEVIEQKGHCAAGHRVGDKITIDYESNTINGKICLHALYSILPKVLAMAYGANFSWLNDPDYATHACPDAHNPVIFAVKRIRNKEK